MFLLQAGAASSNQFTAAARVIHSTAAAAVLRQTQTLLAH